MHIALPGLHMAQCSNGPSHRGGALENISQDLHHYRRMPRVHPTAWVPKLRTEDCGPNLSLDRRTYCPALRRSQTACSGRAGFLRSHLTRSN